MYCNSPDEQAFLRGIEVDPADQFPKLVYADWLEDHGDPRSDLLRKEINAAEILGRENVHGILDAQSFFGPLDEKILEALRQAPFPSNDILKECPDHLLVLHPGCSLEEVCKRGIIIDAERRGRVSDYYRIFSWAIMHSLNYPSARQQRPPSWLLLPRKAFAELFNHTHSEQLELLLEHHPQYQVMAAAELATALAVHAHAQAREPFLLRPNSHLRCDDISSYGEPVSLGSSNVGALFLTYSTADRGTADLGLSSARNF